MILLRERGLLPEEVCERVNRICNSFETRLIAGCIITIAAISVRARDLPLLKRSV